MKIMKNKENVQEYIAQLSFFTTEEHAHHEEYKLFTFVDIYSFDADRDPKDVAFVVESDLTDIATYDGPIKIVNFMIEKG